jgi:hypothetical protein
MVGMAHTHTLHVQPLFVCREFIIVLCEVKKRVFLDSYLMYALQNQQLHNFWKFQLSDMSTFSTILCGYGGVGWGGGGGCKYLWIGFMKGL